jgi:hypothetical protein
MFVLLCVFLRNILFLLIDPSLARIAYGMIKDAEDKGLITPGKVDQIISYIRVFSFSPLKIKLILGSWWFYSEHTD